MSGNSVKNSRQLDSDKMSPELIKCVYKLRRDGMDHQQDCAAPATHYAARNKDITLCEMHARSVGHNFRVVPLVDGYCSFEPERRRR